MMNKSIPCPCTRDCVDRCDGCRLKCKKFGIYEKLKRYEEKKKKEKQDYKDKHYISREDKFKEWTKETKTAGRNASNYKVR